MSFNLSGIEVVLVEGEEDPAPPWPDPETQAPVYIYIDKDVAEFFECQGEFWRERMNAALRQAAFGEEEAEIQAQVAEDPDDFEGDASTFQISRRRSGVKAVLSEDSTPRSDPDTQVPVYIYIDKDVVEFFKAPGELWPERMNAALRSAAFGDEEG